MINYKEYLPCIIKAIKELLKDPVEVYLSGSLAEKKAVPSSDIDIIIVINSKIGARKRADIIAKIEEICNLPFVNPFEFHILSKHEFKNWIKIFKPRLMRLI